MINRLLIAGDSQSAGLNESGDFVKNYGQWIAEFNNLEVTNLSDPGVDNAYIRRKLLFNLDNFDPNNTFVIFHIAPFTRKCFWFDDSRTINKNENIWYRSFTGNSNRGWFRSKGKKSRVPGKSWKFNLLDFKDTFDNTFFDTYFHTYFSLQEGYLETIENLFFVQEHLTNLKYKFLFVVNSKHLFNDDIKHKDEFNFILDKLDFSKFFFFEKKLGFDDFILTNNFTVSKEDYHATAAGHKEFSLLLNKKISLML